MEASKPIFSESTDASNVVLGTPTTGGFIQDRLPTNSQLLPTNYDSAGNDEKDFRCLIATDCHLGFRDREPLIKDDSLRAFEEVLKTAKEKKVDCVLMAGDLFHHNRPSRPTACRTIELLQKYCLGDNPVQINFLSNPKELFAHADPACQKPNWEDPNFNIDLPIFSIHGNHDDPIGPKTMCEMDTLHQQRLVNYFGKVEDMANIEVKPIVMEKSGTVLALYGLGSIKDERLNHLMRNGKVKFIRPTPFQTSDGKQYTANDMFSVLLFHQNRVPRGPKNYIPENLLPDWLNLIVWGHEHDSIPQVSETRFFDNGTESVRKVLQPGSTVATSLSVSEALQKHVFILHITGVEWKIEPIPLKTVRPFYMRDIDLRMMDFDTTANKQVQIENYLITIVEDLIEAAKEEAENVPGKPKEPLIRLRVEYGKDAQPLNQKRFGYRFLGK
nr:MRE11 [Batillipes sp.]